MTWVLIEELASEQRGQTVYFREMVPIGPRTTVNLSEAARFASVEEARRSSAYAHSLCFLEPREVEEVVVPATVAHATDA